MPQVPLQLLRARKLLADVQFWLGPGRAAVPGEGDTTRGFGPKQHDVPGQLENAPPQPEA